MTRKVGPLVRALTVLSLLVVTAGCKNGQLVDAGGERGAGGLAFVLLTVFFWIFFATLFYMDKVRRRRAESDE